MSIRHLGLLTAAVYCRKLGRPPLSDETVELVLRMARENPSWGYDRIAGAIQNLGHDISDQSVGNILKTNDGWMKQMAKNLTAAEDGFLNGKRYVLMDRDGKFSDSFRDLLQNEDIEPVRLLSQSPNLNAYLERFMRSIKEEVLYRLIFFGEGSLRRAVSSYMEHYHGERNHQGLDNVIIEPGDEVGRSQGDVQCRERLGGTLRYYYRDAA